MPTPTPREILKGLLARLYENAQEESREIRRMVGLGLVGGLCPSGYTAQEIRYKRLRDYVGLVGSMALPDKDVPLWTDYFQGLVDLIPVPV